jgi:hypothetical protein
MLKGKIKIVVILKTAKCNLILKREKNVGRNRYTAPLKEMQTLS